MNFHPLTGRTPLLSADLPLHFVAICTGWGSCDFFWAGAVRGPNLGRGGELLSGALSMAGWGPLLGLTGDLL